eukprot:15364577-Ditylum_brightwellii.AAC.2
MSSNGEHNVEVCKLEKAPYRSGGTSPVSDYKKRTHIRWEGYPQNVWIWLQAAPAVCHQILGQELLT